MIDFDVREKILRLDRLKKIAIQVILDMSTSVVILWSLVNVSTGESPATSIFFLVTAILTVSTFWVIGLYTTLIRFLTGKVIVQVSAGCVVGGLTWLALHLGSGVSEQVVISIAYGALSILIIGGYRFLARAYFRQGVSDDVQNVVIVGAKSVGLQIMNSLFHGPGYQVIALVDEDPALKGFRVAGFRVGSTADIFEIVKSRRVDFVILADPSIRATRKTVLVNALKEFPVVVKSLPSTTEIISGKATISDLRDVSVADLLERSEVDAADSPITQDLEHKVVMVSGAGGSIGSELCRQLIIHGPKAIILFEASEYALYRIQRELDGRIADLGKSTVCYPILGSVTDSGRVKSTIESFEVQKIFHAAAFKHVPLVEQNVIEGVRNNVHGTYTMAKAAMEKEVESFTLISTDKAVRPANIMGATKRLAELICQAMGARSAKTVFSMVRFGNVLGSSGSVIPAFNSQIADGGPVTVTHPDITRYFMTIPEAAGLVLAASVMARGGEVFLLDMGEPVKILDLAIRLIEMKGFTASIDSAHKETLNTGDIDIVFTGLRPGEKLYEELLVDAEAKPSHHPKILYASEEFIPLDALEAVLDQLSRSCDSQDAAEVIRLLKLLPLEYKPAKETVSDLIWSERQSRVSTFS